MTPAEPVFLIYKAGRCTEGDAIRFQRFVQAQFCSSV